MKINIIGGGLAGSEAALTLSKKKIHCNLYEIKPEGNNGIHKSENFGELVCSNSLKSFALSNASGLLKNEGKLLDSNLLRIAEGTKVPAGKALAVNREEFSKMITEEIEKSEYINIYRKEITQIDLNSDDIWLIATGPLTSPKFECWLMKVFGNDLFFFDAVSPIILRDSIDMSKAFVADRYEKGTGDYLNCPMNEDEYSIFYKQLVEAELAPIENFSDKALFERCQPVEEIAKRGFDALRFGPMKPVGLKDDSGNSFFAIVQLRKEDKEGNLYSPVGFQTRLKWKEQKKVFSLIPALNNAEFVRYGVMHRNTYLNAPEIMNKYMQSKKYKNVFFAGQISGLEGYVEAIVSGKISALNIERISTGKKLLSFPDDTMIGALINHITTNARIPLSPVYSNYGLLSPVKGIKRKKERNIAKAERALKVFKKFLTTEFY